MKADGLVTFKSRHAFKETADRLEAALGDRGMNVFARVDHAAGATQAGLELRPTVLVVFGNAKAGTPFMQANQATGIDLPLKALIWRDAGGTVWLTYNDLHWIAQRHDLGPDVRDQVDQMAAALAALAEEVTSGD